MSLDQLTEKKVRRALRDVAAPELTPPDVSAAMRAGRRRRNHRRAGWAACVGGGLAATVLGVMAVAGTLPSTVRTTPADPSITGGEQGAPLREVAAWTGETVEFHGVHVPVPEDWTVTRTSATEEGACAEPAAKTVLVVEAPTSGGTPVCLIPVAGQEPTGPSQVVVLHDNGANLFAFAGSDVLLEDPSGQPVARVESAYSATAMVFPWRDAVVRTLIPTSDDEVRRILDATWADSVHAQPGLSWPDPPQFAGYARYRDAQVPGIDNERQLDPDDVVAILDRTKPADSFQCAPVAPVEVHLQPSGGDMMRFLFDISGSCRQILETPNGFATLDDEQLEALRVLVGGWPAASPGPSRDN